jgi:hypothetical protein
MTGNTDGLTNGDDLSPYFAILLRIREMKNGIAWGRFPGVADGV